jgi:RNA polymerase sigma-70 factor (ECF subfamily)
MDEMEAVRLLKRGKIDGLEHFAARYQVKAVRAAFLITQDQAAAEDVVQDTFIRIFQNPNQFDETRPFEPYFMRSVVNAALNACRNDKRFVSMENDLDAIEGLMSQAVSVEEQAEYWGLRNEIIEALKKLPPRERAVVVQRYYLDMSEKEMALTLDTAPGTVKWLLNSARNKLRDLLGRGRHDER